MSESAIWILLGIVTVLALAATRINPGSWRPHRVRWMIIAVVIIGAAALMQLGLLQTHGIGASGVSGGGGGPTPPAAATTGPNGS
jgi:hypothetical protein